MKGLIFLKTRKKASAIRALSLFLISISPSLLLAEPAKKTVTFDLPLSEIIAGQAQPAPQARISLPQAITEALAKNLKLNNLQLDVNSFSLEAEKISRQKFFTLKTTGNYLYKSQTIFYELPGIFPGTGSSGFRLEGGLQHNFDFGLAVSQPISTGGRLSARVSFYRSAELAASRQSDLIVNEIASHLKLLYFEYHRLRAKKNSLLALREQLHLHEQKIASLAEAELTNRLNVLETRMKMEEVATSLLDLDQTLAAIRFEFQRLCDHWPEEVEEDFHEPGLSLEEAIAYFEHNHPQFKIYQEKLNQIELQKRIVQANNFPQIAALAEIHYGRPGLNFFKKDWSLYATVGLAIQFQLFDWHQGRTDIEKLSLEERKIINEREDFAAQIKQELKKLFEQKDILAKKLNHLNDILRLAEEEVKIKEALAQANLLPHLDYLASLQTLEQNRWARQEILILIEEIKVRINSLLARNEEKL
jgi:outer membrane protein TolC